MGVIRKLLSVDRLTMLGVIALQAATILYLYRASEQSRVERNALQARIRRLETAMRTASAARAPQVAPQTATSGTVANDMRNQAESFVRAHAQMEKMLESMFGPANGTDDAFSPESQFAQFDRMHAQTIRMLESSFDNFRLAERSAGLGQRVEFMAVSPAMDMREFDDCYLVAISLPRTAVPELSITLDGRMLFVAGKQNGRRGETWQFQKKIQLPGPVSVKIVTATFTNGILRIVAPKGNNADLGEKPVKIM